MDRYLFIFATSLIVINIIFTYSLSTYVAQRFGYSEFNFLIKESLVAFGSILIMWCIGHIDHKKVFGPFMVIFTLITALVIIMMPTLLTGISVTVGGATRWISLGFITISPAEFLKVAITFYFAKSFTKEIFHIQHNDTIKEFGMIGQYIIIIGLTGYFVGYLQKDLGQFVVIYLIFLILLNFANRNKVVTGTLVLVSVLAVTALVFLEGHRTFRVATWWVGIQDMILAYLPESLESLLRVYDVEAAYQIAQSQNSIYNGGFFGTGLGEGNFKMGFLSEVHTDFVLAGIAEEIGVVGVFAVIILFLLMVIRILQISTRVDDTMYHLFSVGIAVMFSFSFFINIYGITSVIPMKGIAVPFLSYGGSSLLASSFAVGLILSISRARVRE